MGRELKKNYYVNGVKEKQRMFLLNVPNAKPQRERRNSDGCITPGFVSNSIGKHRKSKENLSGSHGHLHMSHVHHHEREKKRVEFEPNHLDQNLIELLRKNYELVSALADIESTEDKEENNKMKGRIPLISTEDSPRPLLLRQHNPYSKYNECESSSMASTESSDSGCEMAEISRWSRVKQEVSFFFSDVAEAFDTPREACPELLTDAEKLSIVSLRKDLSRCYTALLPILEAGAALHDLLLWKNPLATLLLVLVYMYSIVRGWTASLVLALLLLQLTFNYLKTKKNINIGISFLPRREVPSPSLDVSGAQLLLTIAKVAQHLLRFGANFLEKLNSLLTWRDERVSWRFYYLVIYWLTLSLLFNTGTCLGMCGMTLGVRLFFTTYLFERFPRLRNRLDTFGWFYRNLPVKNSPVAQNANIIKTEEERCPSSVSGYTRRSTICTGELFPSRLGSNFNLDRVSSSNLVALSPRDSNSLAVSEPLSPQTSLSGDETDAEELEQENDPMMDNVVAFRSCVLNEKDKMFPKGITAGILYLTDVALIFRARNAGEEKPPLMFLFHDIVSVKKIQSLRSLSLIAGTRKSIELVVAGNRKPVQFIGIAQRDDFVERLQEMCCMSRANTHFIVD